MGRVPSRPSPALFVSLFALFAALGGTVYAAEKINGKAIRVKSLPGNRLKPGSVPGDRLKPGAIGAASLAPNSIGGAQIDEAALGPVPSAVNAENSRHAETAFQAENAVRAESADSAFDSQTALNAVNAVNATTVNGHEAGCRPKTRLFAGACWETSANTASTAPSAAADCASQGGALPEALQLAAFAQQSGVELAAGDEWAGDIVSFTAPGAYGVATVSAGSKVGSAIVNGNASEMKQYRCVIPLVT